MRLLFFLFIAVLVTTPQPSSAQTRPEQSIRKMLATQVQGWNAGNPAAYMEGYWKNDSLVFLGKNGPTYGFDSTLEHYKKSYPDAGAMGKLTSTILKLRLLSENYAYVTGRWELERAAGALSGYYTLLLQKIKGHWVIIEDHTS